MLFVIYVFRNIIQSKPKVNALDSYISPIQVLKWMQSVFQTREGGCSKINHYDLALSNYSILDEGVGFFTHGRITRLIIEFTLRIHSLGMGDGFCITINPMTDILTNPWQLYGHDWAVDMLREHLRADNARHAYMFTGPGGIGKRTLALRFIQAMNCPNGPEPGQPCLQPTCRTCRQINDMQHADLRVIRVPDGKSEIPIDQVREMQAFMMLAPYEAPYKVGLLLNFQAATVQAQNALLKTLEEAPPRARILITADSAESLLETIVSRCEPLRLRPLPAGQVGRILTSEGTTDPAKAELIDHLAAGRIGYARSLAADENLLERRAEWINDLLECLRASLRRRFKIVEESLPKKGDLSRQRQTASEMLLVWQSVFRDMLISKAGAATPLMNIDFADPIAASAAGCSIAQIETWMSACDTALERIERYCNIRLVLENMVEGLR